MGEELSAAIASHPTNTNNEHADVTSEVAKEVTEVIITEQQGEFSGGLKCAHPNPPQTCPGNSGVVLGRVDSSQDLCPPLLYGSPSDFI